MTTNRIVSFLPSATELLFELGAEDRLVGVTHECKYPKKACEKPQIISSVVDSEKLSSKEIDEMTSSLLSEGRDIFQINEKSLKHANPDLIISQNTCEVCAAHTNQVSKAVQILEGRPELHSMDPHNLKEIIQSVRDLGRILGLEGRAKQITEKLEGRIEKVRQLKTSHQLRVVAVEWVEPFFTAGHWVPEMIEIAGGKNMISKTGERSRRMDFQEISDANPDLIILMPCGFDTDRTVSEYNNILRDNERWNELEAVKADQVYAVDADSYFSKPSIRTVGGIEILAKIINPEKAEKLTVPDKSYARIV